MRLLILSLFLMFSFQSSFCADSTMNSDATKEQLSAKKINAIKRVARAAGIQASILALYLPYIMLSERYIESNYYDNVGIVEAQNNFIYGFGIANGLMFAATFFEVLEAIRVCFSASA